MHLKISSAKCRPFCLDLNVLSSNISVSADNFITARSVDQWCRTTLQLVRICQRGGNFVVFQAERKTKPVVLGKLVAISFSDDISLFDSMFFNVSLNRVNWTPRDNARVVLIKIQTISFQKMQIKMLSSKWRSFCLLQFLCFRQQYTFVQNNLIDVTLD